MADKKKRTDQTTASQQSLQDLLHADNKRKKKRLIFGIIPALVILGGAVFAYLKITEKQAAAAAPEYIYKTLTRGNLISSVSSTGTVEAKNTVEVGAEISGRILSLHADFNDHVEKGQVLAQIDKTVHEATVAEAKAKLLSARAQVAQSDADRQESIREAARAEELAAKGLMSSKDLETSKTAVVRAQAAVLSAKASLAIAKANLESAQTNLSKTQIVSPIDGVVLSREVEEGQTINAGMNTPVLFVLAEDLKEMSLSSLVDEADIGRIQEGQTATFQVDAFADKAFSSKVISVRNVATTQDNVVSYEVLLNVDNTEKLLKPGMTASVEIITESYNDQLLVPNAAFRFSPKSASSSSFRRPPGGMPFMFGGGGNKNNKGNKGNGAADRQKPLAAMRRRYGLKVTDPAKFVRSQSKKLPPTAFALPSPRRHSKKEIRLWLVLKRSPNDILKQVSC